ncbi:MAG: twin-arginine translocase subunit TatC [Pseudomonadota bacterium]
MSDASEKLAEGTLISHLLELRSRLVRAVTVVVILILPAAYFRNQIFDTLAAPLIKQLPKGASLITTGVMTPFTTPFKLSIYVALFAAMPYVLYQIWAFVAPGLYRKEKKFAVPLLVSSILLFYIGMAFAYQFVFPVLFKFFAGATPTGVQMMPDITSYMDWAMTMFLSFGVAFEVPVAVVLLALTGMVSVETLATSRGYVVIGIFVVAAILTPPDPISMTLMAMPMWLLYELGLIMARVMVSKPEEEKSAATDADA